MSLTELDHLAARVKQFIRAATLSQTDSSDTRFESLALELFARQYELNESYGELCRARGVVPGTVGSWEEIPAMPTAAFKELVTSALPESRRFRVFHSSGTTEHRPSRHFHCRESLAVYEASLWPWFGAHLLPGFPLGRGGTPDEWSRPEPKPAVPMSLVLLTPPPESVAHSSLVHMFGVIAREVEWNSCAWLGSVDHGGGWTIDARRACAVLSAAVQHGEPVMVLGTAFSFVHLLDDLSERQLRLRLPSGSRVLETGGYKGRSRALSKQALHDLIKERLGISEASIVCEYGMSELSSQAYDRVCGTHSASNLAFNEKAGWFQFPPWVRIQIVSPETGLPVEEGETGLIRVFDLANVYSVMAIQTEDLAVKRTSGFELRGRSPVAEPRGCSLMAAR